jgi:colanic acid biosynthesis glycosyl transferase WcaI
VTQALLITQYYRPELIGSAPFCADLAEWIAQNRGAVTVMTSFPHYPNAEAFRNHKPARSDREVINGVGVRRLRNWVPRRMTALRRIVSEGHFLALGALAILMRRMPRQALVVSLSPSILSVALGAVATSPGGRHVALVHDIQSGLAAGLGLVRSGWFVRAMRGVERAVLNRADLIIVLSREMRDHLRAMGVVSPIEIVPIWVDADNIQPMPHATGDRVRVLYSGNLGRKQGLGQIVALAEELQRRRSTVELVLRGSGSEAGRLGDEIGARRLTNIEVLPLLPAKSLSQGLAQGDIHLVPQDPEAADFAMPSKVFNIMASGRPFVATARPGSSLWRLCEESGGFLCVPPNDARAFADAVQRLAADATLRAALGRRGRCFVEQHRSKTRILTHFLSLIDDLRDAA